MLVAVAAALARWGREGWQLLAKRPSNAKQRNPTLKSKGLVKGVLDRSSAKRGFHERHRLRFEASAPVYYRGFNNYL